jgi:hypothetical protein
MSSPQGVLRTVEREINYGASNDGSLSFDIFVDAGCPWSVV